MESSFSPRLQTFRPRHSKLRVCWLQRHRLFGRRTLNGQLIIFIRPSCMKADSKWKGCWGQWHASLQTRSVPDPAIWPPGTKTSVRFFKPPAQEKVNYFQWPLTLSHQPLAGRLPLVRGGELPGKPVHTRSTAAGSWLFGDLVRMATTS